MRYYCQNQRRRGLVRTTLSAGVPRLNGIDYLEVLSADQRTLGLHFIHPLTDALDPGNFAIDGGVRVQQVRVESMETAAGDGRTLRLTVNQAGDFSTYRLRLVASPVNNSLPSLDPPLDPQLAAVEFSFKVNCPDPFDCPQPPDCPPEPVPAPRIDYLAKDYASFRQLMLDRMAVTLPEWRERNPADMGIALVETLAYAADYLSYYQDSVATEAYLDTAHQRASVRRHSRLLNYPFHEGCNSRAWVQLQVSAIRTLEAETPFLTRVVGTDTVVVPGSPEYRTALEQAEGFEALHPQWLCPGHANIRFYTWSDDNCCLPKGATRATLRSEEGAARLRLQPGDMLILEEVVSPETGRREDAELSRRHPVRLTRVVAPVQLSEAAVAGLGLDGAAQLALDELIGVPFVHDFELLRQVESLLGDIYNQALAAQLLEAATPLSTPTDDLMARDPLTDELVVEIEWHEDDALPFPLCLSKTIDDQLVEHLTLAQGNLVLVDHGLTFIDGPGQRVLVPPAVEDPQRHRPRLVEGPLTQRVPFQPAAAQHQSAAALRQQNPHQALPAVALEADGETWEARRDLLNSDRFSTTFVVEMDRRRTARLRFGDGVLGRRLALGAEFTTTYRLGSGLAGNVGAEAITHVVTDDGAGIEAVRSPLPAVGGTDPEAIVTAKLNAPQAFRVQQRAVTAADYSDVARRHPQVQQAQATRRWTGSWYTWFLTVDRQGGRPVDAEFEAELRQFLERFRLAGYDLEIDAPRFVPLDIAFSVCVQPGYYPRAVEAALLETFGVRGFFHPDRFTFGQPVYLSQLVAAAMAVPGVQWVDFSPDSSDHRFQRWGRSANQELQNGEIPMERLEIARLDNDPNAPENGRLEFLVEGGR